MRKIDDIIPDIGFIPALIIVVVLAIALELSGAWITMIIAGVFGGLFTRKTSRAFLAGFLGVGLGWGLLLFYLSLTAEAMAIANIFIGLLGLSGMGWLVIVVSVLIGALLGGFGGLLGRSLVEFIDDLSSKRPVPTPQS
ncbi:MAG: hypothetical protein C4K47_08380 [Candidatus Thorarchaeota archaeon]|nr:MAG: hypothetical protein C4K47_08380 [Candidatus Thorarchaeota archaeon]